MKVLSFILANIVVLHTCAQELNEDSLIAAGICNENGFCIPSLSGLPRPKGIELNYTQVLNYDITTKYENSDEKFQNSVNNRRVNFKVKVPLVLDEKLTLSLGFAYENEEFAFKNEANLDNPFQNYLNDRDLQMIGAKLYIIKPLKGVNYLASRLSYRLSSDFRNDSYKEQSRASASFIYGKKSSKHLTWGVGLSYSYAFGRQALYPLLAYSKILNDKWSLDMLLPVTARLRYMPNQKNVFLITPQVGGDKYYVTVNEHSPEMLYLEKASLNLLLTYEREIHDFFWITCSVGARTNLNFRLSQKNAFLERTTPVITNDLKDALLVKAGIFIVPPKKWMNKNK